MAQTDFRQLHGDFFADVPILVTGGAGFIGSHIARALATVGAKVTCLDDLSSGNPDNLLVDGVGGIKLIEGSVTDAKLVADCVGDCQYIFHQAALVSVPESIEKPDRYHHVNVTGTLNVLEAARHASVRRVMFAASAAAYGDDPSIPQCESQQPRPLSPYAANKIQGEVLMQTYAACYQLDTASLRYFNIFGPGQSANSAYAAVIAAFANILKQNNAPTIHGDGEQTRDFTYVDNVVHANLLAARSDKALSGYPINIATGRAITVNHLATVMTRLMNKFDLEPTHGPDRSGDIKHSLADISRARKILDYQPVTDFETGLASTVEWYMQS